MTSKYLHLVLKIIMKEKCVDSYVIADRLKCDIPYLDQLLSGTAQFTDKQITEFCKILEIPEDFLMELAKDVEDDDDEFSEKDPKKWEASVSLLKEFLTFLPEDTLEKAIADLDHYLDPIEENYRGALQEVVTQIEKNNTDLQILLNVELNAADNGTIEKMQKLAVAAGIQDTFTWNFSEHPDATVEDAIHGFANWLNERNFNLLVDSNSDDYLGYICPKESSEQVLDLMKTVDMEFKKLPS